MYLYLVLMSLAAKMAVSMANSSSYKLQVVFSDKQRATLGNLQEITDAESAAQVVRDALRIYESLVNAKRAGHRLLMEDPETGKRTYLEFL